VFAARTMESIDKGISTTVENIRNFVMTNDFAQYKLGSSVVPDNQFISLIPAVSVSFSNMTKLRQEQAELMKIKLDKKAIWEDVIDSYTDLAFNPASLFQFRNNDMVIFKQSKLAARLVTWFSDYQTLRNDSLFDHDQSGKTLMMITKDDTML